jgi:hypothetical protein
MPAPLFVLGAPRSGTTLLRVMLAGHPDLFSPPEMVIAPFATMAERRKKLDERFWEKGGLRRTLMELLAIDTGAARAAEAALEDKTVPEVYAWLQERLGSRILVDKCPHLGADPDALQRLLRWFPDARFVWIVRHPGSVTRSIENMPMAEVMLQGYAPDARDIWYFANKNIRDFLAGVPEGRKARIHYEAMVGTPEAAMRALCHDVDLPFHPALLTPYEGERMREGPSGARAVGDPNMAGRGAIQPELATKWLQGFDPASVSPATHALARELGYDLGALDAPPIASVSTAISALFDSARRLEQDLRMPADLDNVEGRRFLLRMLAQSVDLFVEEGDADRPRFHHAEGPTRKMFADNPDADYWRAPIRLGGGRRYLLRGRVPPGTAYVGVLLYRKGGQVGNHRHDRDFVQADGTFSLTLSADDSAELRGHGDEIAVMVRQYFTDRAREAPITLEITLEGAPPPESLDPHALARQLDRARRNLEVVFERTLGTWKMASVGLLNRFTIMEGAALFPTPDNTYAACWYRFGEDQLMFVHGRLGRSRYWSFCLYNAFMESLEYRDHRVSLNHTQLVCDADGNYEICLAHRDPGHPNWVDTTGHHAGYALIRVLLAEEEVLPPTIEVKYVREWNSGR